MPLLGLKIKQINTNRLSKQILRALDTTGKRNEDLLVGTTRTFNTVKPTFVSEVEEVDGDLQVTTAPLDDEWGQIWSYLNDGTEVRFAWMTDDFMAKTTPGTFETGAGMGGFRNLNTNLPADGIEARGWTELLAEEEEDGFVRRVQNAITDAMRRLF